MLTLNGAVEAARPYLAQAFAHEPWAVVVQPQLSEEHDLAWIIRYDTQQSIDTLGRAAGPLTRVVLVPKDGSPVRFPPSHLPLDEYFAYVRHGGWDTGGLARTVRAEPWQMALQWLLTTYRGLVELASIEPVAEDAGTWLFACQVIEQPGYPRTPTLAASVVVPKDLGVPFHPAADDPWGDAAEYTRNQVERDPERQALRLNSRGCVVTVAAAIAGRPSSPLPWQPAHEAPGWWQLLLRRYFPTADQLRCADWDEVIAQAEKSGPGTQGVVWVRRAIRGTEVSGHLVYAHNNNGTVVFLDGMTGGLARLDTVGLRELVFARVKTGVPRTAKGPEEPFLLPNSDPWGFLDAWNRGEAMGPTPASGDADWFAPTMAKLGPVLEVSEFSTITESVRALAALHVGGRALVWVRRQDDRGRESTGLLLTGLHTHAGHVGLIDGSANELRSLDTFGESGVRVIRYR
ncbi:toxin glutamine deamidase domain-containing protein [Streptomyces sp. NPDC058289]|uniref:toxin glutamine deamidase domain-containing protein n=1 Tax=Streptomyces sp. NPDC058289 TaxID=3346425 RepID=UPI0036E3FAC0